MLTAPTKTLKPSQRCPDCERGQKKHLEERTHACPCGCTMGRDGAAARVMLRWGLEGNRSQELAKAA